MHTQKQWDNFCKKQKEIREREKINHFHKWVNTNDNEKKLFILLDQINIAFKDSEYKFKDKKEFKDELATFIYKLSHNA
tara:strand:- start:9739 stop:9975 length:237 start_codon:yes stop_codon:yes gene_type:complete